MSDKLKHDTIVHMAMSSDFKVLEILLEPSLTLEPRTYGCTPSPVADMRGREVASESW